MVLVAKQLSRALILWLLAVLVFLEQDARASNVASGFVKTKGTGFVVNGRPFYPNGFNAYWLMQMAWDPAERSKVPRAFRQASRYGLTAVRTWAFSDGGIRPLQSSPGSYDEVMFQGLDFVIAEARKHGVYLILSLVNNFDSLGGKKQYVEWATEQGEKLNSDDDFYTNDVVKGYYKDHAKKILTRINTITGMAYRDDPTIFAWELMNEPRCENDPSGRTLEAWIEEMAVYVKTIDANHLLEVGLEGFFGKVMHPTVQPNNFNSIGTDVGTDFISNNHIPWIDFATIHLYPDQWVPGLDDEKELEFIISWIHSHTEIAGAVLKKPLVITEFGRSASSPSWDCNWEGTVAFYRRTYKLIYELARVGSSCTGGLFWQLLLPGMDPLKDGYEIVLSQCPSVAKLISRYSLFFSSLANHNNGDVHGTTRTSRGQVSSF